MRLAEGVSFYGPGVSAFSISHEGTLVFRQDAGWHVWQPVWLDRTGRELSDVGPRGTWWSGNVLFPRNLAPDVFRPCLSPDGRSLAVTRASRFAIRKSGSSTCNAPQRRHLLTADSMACRSGRPKAIAWCGAGRPTRDLMCI